MKSSTAFARRAYAALKGVLALVGAAAIALALLPVRSDELLPQLAAFAAESLGEAETSVAGPIQASAFETVTEREQRALTEYIARRYRVAETAAGQYVSLAYRAGAQHRVEPSLILAVMAIESRYNPVAESGVGAKGLMQVIPKYHQEKLLDHGGEPAVLDPEVNILVGAQILREYQRRFGDTETALQQYAGALDEPTAQYSAKVFAEKARLDALRFRAKKLQTASAV